MSFVKHLVYFYALTRLILKYSWISYLTIYIFEKLALITQSRLLVWLVCFGRFTQQNYRQVNLGSRAIRLAVLLSRFSLAQRLAEFK